MSRCTFVPVTATQRLASWIGIAAVAFASGLAVAADGPAPAEAAPAASQPAGPPPKFRCDEPEYKFGQVWAMGKVEHTFTIHNDGQGALTIEAKPTCGCTVAEYDKTIPPGGQGKVKTVLTSGNYTTTYRKVINVITNDPQKPTVPLVLSGEVKQRVSSEPHLSAYFGQFAPGAELTKKFKMTNNTDQPMKLEIVPPSTPVAFKASIREIEPGKTAEIAVTAEPPFVENNNVAQFTIKTGLEGVPDMILPCSIIKPPVVQVLPPALRLPISPVANPFRQPITIRNNGEDPLKVLSVEANDPAIKHELKETSPGKVWMINVEVPSGFTPNPEKSPLLTITTDFKDKPVYTVPLISLTPPRQTAAPVVANAESLVGARVPTVTIPATDGRQIKPGSGQVTLVNFWASWCIESRKQLGMLEELAQTYQRRGVEFVNVSVDKYRKADELRDMLRAMDSKITLALDADQRVAKAFGVLEAPTMFLVSKTGVVEAVRRGIGRDESELELLAQTLAEQLDTLLEGKTRANFAPRPISIGTPCRLQQLPFSPASTQGSAALTVEALSQDAGLFKPASEGEYKLYVANAGTQPLEIKAVKPSPGLSIAPSAPKSLDPGATGVIHCKFKAPSRPETFTHQVTLESTGANPLLNVAITGQTRPYLELQPKGGIDFADRARTFSVPRIATILYNGPDSVEFKTPKSSSPKFEAEIRPTRRPSVSIVTVKALPPFEPGETKATITIETNVADQPVFEVPVKLYMPQRIEVKPAKIELPAAQSMYQAQVNITNSGETALDILEIKKSRPEIQTQFFPEPDGLSYRLQLTFPPDFTCGAQGEQVTIRTGDKDYGEIVIPISKPQPPAR